MQEQTSSPTTTLPSEKQALTCQHCGHGKLHVIDEGPDPIFGVLGMTRQTLLCDYPECGKLTYLSHLTAPWAKASRPVYRLSRVACVACIVTLAALALLPAEHMTRTTLGGHAEHLIAYLGTALATGVALHYRLD
jgi:hypothetical protein